MWSSALNVITYPSVVKLITHLTNDFGVVHENPRNSLFIVIDKSEKVVQKQTRRPVIMWNVLPWISFARSALKINSLYQLTSRKSRGEIWEGWNDYAETSYHGFFSIGLQWKSTIYTNWLLQKATENRQEGPWWSSRNMLPWFHFSRLASK